VELVCDNYVGEDLMFVLICCVTED